MGTDLKKEDQDSKDALLRFNRAVALKATRDQNKADMDIGHKVFELQRRQEIQQLPNGQSKRVAVHRPLETEMTIVAKGETVALCRWTNPNHDPKWRLKDHFDRWIGYEHLVKGGT